jgi:PPK2 family polyphosphate:nucleotide phosphotransferase
MRETYARTVDGTKRVRLDRIDPADTGGVEKEQALEKIERLGRELSELENLLTYAGTHALLIVLQGRDASGKDGAARKILGFTNVQNAYVHPFKAPTEDERTHDFLWRAHKAVPGRGYMAIFNRSHYEDVIAARVRHLVPKKIWKRRYDHINAFETLLLDSDVILLKFCLNVSHDEQYERLIAREQDPRTAWKLNPEDWRERAFWDDVTEAYDDVLKRCASPEAPWYLVAADKKWFRDLAILERLVLTLRPYRDGWLKTLGDLGKTRLKEIRELRRKGDTR